MKTHTRLSSLLLTVTLVALGACGEDSGPSGGANATRTTDLTLLVSASGEQSATADGSAGAGDSAIFGDIHAAVVTVAGVYIQPDAGDDESPKDPIWLSQERITADLATLVNASMTMADTVSVESGVQGELRIVFEGAYVAVAEADGSTSIFATSRDYPGLPEGTEVDGALSFEASGTAEVAVELPGGQIAIGGEEQSVLIQIDVTDSFSIDVENDAWLMHPEVEATDVEATGSIEVEAELAAGVTLPSVAGSLSSLGDLQVRLTDGQGDVRLTALTNVDGDAQLEAVFPLFDPADGPFAVELVGAAGLTLTTEPGLPAGVEVSSGETTRVALSITGATRIDVALTGSLAVTLTLASGVDLPMDVSLDAFVAHLSDASGEVAAQAFTEVGGSGSFEVMFDDVAAGGSYAIEITAAEGIDFAVSRALPEAIAVEADAITYVDVALSAVSHIGAGE